MSTTTLVLYLVVFGFWAFSIFRDGGIGLGARFLFGINTALFFLVGPALAQIQGETTTVTSIPIDVPRDPAVQLALEGLLAYIVAAYWVFPWLHKESRSPAARLGVLLRKHGWAETHGVLGWWLFGIGIASLPLNSFMFELSTVRAVWSTVNSLAETGLLLVCLAGLGTRQYYRIVWALSVLAVYSLVYSAMGGHIGGQFLKGLFILCIIFLGHGLQVYRTALVLFFAALAYVPYQQWLVGRSQLRAAITEQQPFYERLAIVIGIFADPFPALNQEETIAASYSNRGDYTELLAAALEYTPAVEPFAYGSTLLDIFVALVPRALWPDKPFELGGSAFVTKYTGIAFGEGTSVATGLLFELYINFGTGAVLIGMFLLGLGFAWLERKFYVYSGKNHWGALAAIICMWTVGMEANSFAMAAMTIPPAMLVAWVAGYLIPLARDRFRRRKAALLELRASLQTLPTLVHKNGP
jgi:hypothetical protein